MRWYGTPSGFIGLDNAPTKIKPHITQRKIWHPKYTSFEVVGWYKIDA